MYEKDIQSIRPLYRISFGGFGEWITVDLGSSKTLSQVVLAWNSNYPKSYTIRVSADNSAWTTVFSTTSGDGGTDTINFSSVSARYVQMNSTVWSSKIEHVWLKEFEIY